MSISAATIDTDPPVAFHHDASYGGAASTSCDPALKTLQDIEDIVRTCWQLKQMLMTEAWTTDVSEGVSNTWELQPMQIFVLIYPSSC